MQQETADKHSEEALRASELGYRRLFETAKDGILILDAKTGQITDVNPFLINLLGYSRDDFIGTPLWEIGPFKNIKECKLAFLELQKKECIRYDSLPLETKDGRSIAVEFVSNVYGLSGGTRVIQCNIRDIRERRRAEEVLRESEERYRLLVEGAKDHAIFLLDPLGRVVSWNTGAQRMKGYTEQEIIGRNISCFYTPEDVERGEPEQFLKAAAENGLAAVEGWRVRKDGSRFWAEVVSNTLRNDSGRVRGFSTVTRDITERKLAATEISRLNRALRVLSAVNQALNKTPEEAILLQKAVDIFVNVGGYPLAWIATAANDPEHSVKTAAVAGKASEYLSEVVFSWNENDVRGCGPTGVALREGLGTVIQDYSSSAIITPWAAAAKKHGISSNLTVPLLVQGHPVAALMVYAAENDAFGEQEIRLIREVAENLQAGIAAIRDHLEVETERERRRQVEEQLRQAQKLEAVGQLAGGIAHDFNNLLMVIMAETEMLSIGLEGTAAKRAESVMNSAGRAAKLTGQLLAFSRKQPVQPTVTSMNQLVASVSDMLRRLVREDIDVHVALQNEPWPVKADRSQFGQVIMNLVVNARDAMPNGGRLTIETGNAEIREEYAATHPLVPCGNYAMLAVTDTGMGMSAEVQARLFEPFFTTKEQGKGTGLGLSMVYGIVKQAGGFIWVYSELGKGTCFKIYLPKVESGESPAPAEPATPARSVHSSSATILLVEDDESLRDVISGFLRLKGHKVIAADCLDEACRVALENRQEIDLLLTDVILKGGNAMQLVHRLEEQGCVFRVVYMSGYAPSAILHQGMLAHPGTRFLQKPFSQTALLDEVEEALSSGS
jgi:PAS domain S-box-containing protein